MKFRCDKSGLTEAVSNVSRVIPSKSSIPVLEGILLKARDGSVFMTGYDTETGITTSLEADIMEEGEIVLTAHLFSDMLRRMDGDDVTVEVGDKNLTEIRSGMTCFTILGTPSDEYPELPEIEEGTGIDLEQGALKSMIDQTLFAVSQSDAKPVHTGSLFDLGDGVLSIVSVDGYRLAMRVEKTREGESFRFVVPGKALSEISKLLRDGDEKPASLSIGGRHILFRIGAYSFISRLLEGEFLDYKNSIPEGSTTTVGISTRAFIDSIERVSLLISDRLRSPLRVIFDEDRIRVSCSTSLGRSYDELECETEGPTVEMGFNNKYLLDALKAADTDRVLIQISGALSPIKIVPPEGDGFLFLVLPVRLKNEA